MNQTQESDSVQIVTEISSQKRCLYVGNILRLKDFKDLSWLKFVWNEKPISQ